MKFNFEENTKINYNDLNDNSNNIDINTNLQKNGFENKQIIHNNKIKKYQKKFNTIYKNNNHEINQDKLGLLNKTYLKKKINPYILYRQSITNIEIYVKKNIENENEQRTEISSNAELVNSINENSPDKHREEYREEIIYLNPNYEENFMEISQNENDLESNITFNNKNKFHKEYIYKKKPNRFNNNLNHKKCKTFIEQINYNNINHSIKNESVYNVKFPKSDKPTKIQNESDNSSLDENMENIKDEFENINKYNSNIFLKNKNFKTTL